MITIDGQSFFPKDALLDRLTNGVIDSMKEVVFVVGAPLTAPTETTDGVSDVKGITEMIKNHFKDGSSSRKNLEHALLNAENEYQTAFEFLVGHRGQDLANCIVRKAVLAAHKTIDIAKFDDRLTGIDQAKIDAFDKDVDGWYLSPAVNSLGELVTLKPSVFGKNIITSNFDPLIGTSIKKAGGVAWKTLLYADGDLSQSEADGCRVIHIHGYWKSADTLHTGSQLLQKRPSLKTSIQKMLSDKTVVVLAYGGWDDIFTATLKDLVANNAEFPEVIWTFFSETPSLSKQLKAVLSAGINRNRVTLYSGINCHTFIPELVSSWKEIEISKIPENSEKVLPVKRPKKLNLSKLDSDRPPAISTWVGRNEEMQILIDSTASVVAITGIGGEGKSVLASYYLSQIDINNTQYSNWDWRDCREQGDRIRTQIISTIERLTDGTINGSMLLESSNSELVEVFATVANDCSAAIVLDNVDHYVDFGVGRFIGFLDELVQHFARTVTTSRLILTCRPAISYDLSSFESIALTGLPFNKICELYRKKIDNGEIPDCDLEEVYEFTNGHAFWNDLLASQVARGNNTIPELLEDFRRGRRTAPDIISSIWETLRDREKIVLQVMSETVRPENQETLARMISGQLNFNKFSKAIKSLQALSLIVVKPERNSPDLFDLHPLVRSFIHLNFNPTERSGFIKIVLSQYAVIISGIGKMLGVHLPRPLLERYSQKAELEIQDRQFEEALSTLNKIDDVMIGSGNNEEFIRVSRRLFESIDWEIQSQVNSNFDSVLGSYVECLNLQEEYENADDLLAKFEKMIPKNTARYIKYCDIMCNTYRIREEYDRSINWGEVGVKLKEESHLDTTSDCSHHLALSRREGGAPAESLKYFLKQYNLDDFINPNNVAEENDGSAYGNVGRCLQLMGRTDDALICFKKSALVLEKDNSRNRIGNRGWAREWIAEALAEKGYDDLAFLFYKDAVKILENSAPARTRRIKETMKNLNPNMDSENLSDGEVSRRVIAWITQR